MADLVSPPPPARLTLPQQALLNFMAAWALEVMADNQPDLEALIAEGLPAAREAVPVTFAEVLEAADRVADCAARRLPRGHTDWWHADHVAKAALIRLFTARGVAAARAHDDSLIPATPQKDAANA